MARDTLTLNRGPRPTRETMQSPEPWTPPSVLPDPEPKDGFVFRWVATEVAGESVKAHTSLRFREGWEPCRAEDHPEFSLLIEKDAKDGLIKVGGLLLCKMPQERSEARAAYYRKMASENARSVDNNLMKESDPRMPLSRPERRTQVVLGGSKVVNSDDT